MTTETRAPAGSTTIHLVPHTHWDREWYRPFQSFRMQLVDLVDRVLDMLDAQPGFRFTLDGQLATVDDYLEIRPDQEERIARHVRSGRLAVGPWLILMDEFLVSGETLVRNLEAGWRRAEELGGPMRVGYLPDMFGHVAQMPQILRRAGLTDAIVWRGVPAAVDRHAFRWEAPDGSAVRAEYLFAGYGNAALLFAVPDAIAPAAQRFGEAMSPWFGDDPQLGMYGTDHTAPVPELAALVSRLNELADAPRVRIDTLSGYVAAAAPLAEDAPTWRGELRSSARANLLMGVTSARIDVKRAAGLAERLLERYAEPLSALHLPAEAWPKAFLDLAWRRVIENSAHDSICGCSIDPVVDQVLVRYAEAQQVARTLAQRAVAGAATAVPRGALTVMNPSPVARTDEIEAELTVPEDWEAVSLELADGVRVATQEVARHDPILLTETVRAAEFGATWQRFHGREVFDHVWNGYRIEPDATPPRLVLEVDVHPDPEALDVEGLRAAIDSVVRQEPDREWIVQIAARARRRLLARVPLPALGWTAVRAVPGSTPPADAVHASADGTELRNGRLALRVAGDGTFEVIAADGTACAGVGRVVDGGNFGDSYNYGPPASDRLVETPESVSVAALEAGPLRGRIAIERTYAWPVGLTADGTARADETAPLTVRTELELRAGEPFVRVALAFENRADDHRVRLCVPLPRGTDTSAAEGQFAVVDRGMTAEGGYREEPLPTFPAHGWLDAGGMAVLLQHVTEYELTDAPGAASGRELALTVLRSTGLISRNDNPYRMDPAGPQIAIPAAQMRGPWRVAFALLPHAGDWLADDIPGAAEAYRLPAIAVGGLAAADAPWPPGGAGATGLALEGSGVGLSALGRDGDGWLRARLVNLGRDPVVATLDGVTAAETCDLFGRGTHEPLGVDQGRLALELAAAEIRTVRLRRPETARAVPDILDAVGPRQSI